jgi:6,7-dimethyl-8-ribityllumazine synthase
MSAKFKQSPSKIHIAIVAGRFNDFITKSLLHACLTELKAHSIGDNQVTTVWVPGSLEMPVAALKLAKKKNIDAVICLGAVIRGDTYHFEIVSNETGRGLMDVSLTTQKPIIMGVLTTDTIEQAQKRAREKGPNKGRDCAMAAIEMVHLLKRI